MVWLFLEDVRDRRGRWDTRTGSVVGFMSMPASSPGMVTSLLPKVSRLMTSCGSGRLRLALTDVPGKSNSLWPKEAQFMVRGDGELVVVISDA